jgi:hypothetical protein
MPNVLCDFHEMGTNSTYFSNQENPLEPIRLPRIKSGVNSKLQDTTPALIK